jgi:transposase
VARRRRHSQAFKLAAVVRMRDVEDVAGLAAELGVDRGLLYKWTKAFERGGAEALRFPGERSRAGRAGCASGLREGAADLAARQAAVVPAGTAELERKVAQQALELDFFRAALQHFAGPRRKDGGTGGTGSTS